MIYKKGLAILLFFFICFYFSTSSINASLDYFGYYNVNGLPVDSRDHITEIGAMKNSNVAHIIVKDLTRVPEYLAEMRQNNMKAVINVFWIFRGSTWQDNWANLKNSIQGNEDVVYGFYFDEPFWNGFDSATFRTYTKQIKDDYPNKAVMAVEAYPPIENNTIPVGYFEYVTDLGFDFYPTLYTLQSGGFEAAWQRYLSDFSKFEALAVGKKVWLVPDGWNNESIDSSILGTALTRYYNFALTKSNVVGLLVFRYDPGDNTTYYTIQDVLNPNSRFYNSVVAQTHYNIGKSIIVNTVPLPTAAPTNAPTFNASDQEPDGDVDYTDFNILVSKFGLSGVVGWIRSDIIKDGVVNIFDFNKLITNFGL